MVLIQNETNEYQFYYVIRVRKKFSKIFQIFAPNALPNTNRLVRVRRPEIHWEQNLENLSKKLWYYAIGLRNEEDLQVLSGFVRSIEVNLKTIRSLNANGTRNIYRKKDGFITSVVSLSVYFKLFSSLVNENPLNWSWGIPFTTPISVGVSVGSAFVKYLSKFSVSFPSFGLNGGCTSRRSSLFQSIGRRFVKKGWR